MRRLLLSLLLVIVPLGASPQEDDRGFLQATIEDALSDAGRQVRIVGFEGALSSEATLSELTVADDDGIWLTLRDVELVWSRTALLRGRLEVERLTAQEILLPRLPTAPVGDDSPTPEATPFALPDLPVSVNVGEISAARISLGPTILGQPLDFSILGAMQLDGGAGSARLEANRLDGAVGRVALSAAFDNEARVLGLSLLVEEAEGGLVASLLNIPGRPSVRLSVEGEAPLSDYAATIGLATAGEDRITGRVTVADLSADTPDAGRVFGAEVSGDVTPLFAPQYRDFFGTDVGLLLAGTRTAEGGLDIGTFELTSDALALQGRLLLAPGGLPERIAVAGRVSSRDGGPVLLPLSGPETRVDLVTLDVGFDASESENWTAVAAISGLAREGFQAETLKLDGEGRIGRGADGQAFAAAAFDFEAEALDLGSEEAETALGQRVSGRADIDWRAGQPVNVGDLSLAGETYALKASGTVDISEQDITIAARADVTANDLTAFAGLAGRPLSGAVFLQGEGQVGLLTGGFDVTASGRANSLQIAQVQADRLLDGAATVELSARRDETGLVLERFTAVTPVSRIEAEGRLSSEGGSGSVTADLDDAGLLIDALEGPAKLAARTEGSGTDWAVEATLAGTGLDAAVDGAVGFGEEVPSYQGLVTAAVADLERFAPLVGRDIGGDADLRAEGTVSFDLQRIDLRATLSGNGLKTGIAQADRLLDGASTVELSARRDDTDLALDRFAATTAVARIEAEGRLTSEGGSGSVKADLDDAGLLVDGFDGPARLAARTEGSGTDWEVEATIAGTGLDAAVDGAVDLGQEVPAYRGLVTATVTDLARFAPLVGRDIGGDADLRAEGTVSFDLQHGDLRATLAGNGLKTGIAQADRILAGEIAASIDAARDGDSATVRAFSFDSLLLDASGQGRVSPDDSALEFEVRLADIAPFVADLSGAVTATGKAARGTGDWSLDLQANGPGSANARLGGTAAEDFSTVDLSVTGRAPLELANRTLAPRAVAGDAGFDLRVAGVPDLTSVSGRVTTSGARFFDPGAGIALEQITANATLSNGRVDLDVTSAVREGGRIGVSGPLTLTAPFDGDLSVRLDQVVLRDPALYETTASGTLAISGPMAGGANIKGRIELGRTEVQIPSGSVGGPGAIPDIEHRAEPADVRRTRDRAGLLERGKADRGPGPSYGLDVVILAPNQIFIRGRGLDAELGGRLAVTGTTDDVVPVGRFELVRGRLDIFGRRLVLSEGEVTLRGNFDAFLRLEAVTDVEDVTIRVVVEGPVTDPQIRFLSSPDLPEDEVVARLLFGKGIDTLSPIQAAQLAASIRTLSGAGGPGLLARVREKTGLDDLDVTTSEEGTTAVRAGRYLTDDVYTDVTVDSAGETEINLNFDLSPRVTLKGSVATTGETGIGIFFERDY